MEQLWLLCKSRTESQVGLNILLVTDLQHLSWSSVVNEIAERADSLVAVAVWRIGLSITRSDSVLY